MEYKGVNELRQSFMDFFVSKDHYPKSSFSLVPEKDKSLLLINSGMAPIKPYFSGAETPPKKRMVTYQKCIRTGDIEIVGITARHATFFEMLGNFSFGDYFKREAIAWGWEYITEVLKLPEERLWATIYEEDDEAFELWQEIVGMPKEKIVKLGKKDNFWEIGTGPCGPCSEVYYDRGEAYGCGDPDCKPGCECDRYMEFWNYVFTQFDKQEDGTYLPLAHPNIDTGMGLERIASIIQEVDSIFEIDTIKAIIDEVARLAGKKYPSGIRSDDISMRIITDHIRSITFMISDGIMPGNEGREYVLRRLLRRAARHGRLLDINEVFLAGLADKVIENSSVAYPELIERRDYIKRIINMEEERFASTLDLGYSMLQEIIKEDPELISAEAAFKLYDTYGFPLELTKEIAGEHGISVDEEGFNRHMEIQRETARAARHVGEEAGWEGENPYHDFPATEFVGYTTLEDKSRILGIVKPLKETEEKKTVHMVLDKTPFYAMGGGQRGDEGRLIADGFEGRVKDVFKVEDVIVHVVEITSGEPKEGGEVSCIVDFAVRNASARNHTATHLLHHSLRQVLGEHVQQAGSSVNDETLRFDFTHFEPVSTEDLRKIENLVNGEILRFKDVSTAVMSIDDAKKTGALSLFGEKYSDEVRVVSIPGFGSELCGGTHVSNTGQIGAFKILSESGIAAGVRRIEAITGHGILRGLDSAEQMLHDAADLLKTKPDELLRKTSALIADAKAAKKVIEELKKKSVEDSGSLIDEAVKIAGVKLLTKLFEGQDIKYLREVSDRLKSEDDSLVLVLAAESEGKVSLIVSVSDNLLDKGYHAGKLVKEIAAAAGGSGGGKADMGQAGVKDASAIEKGFDMAEKLVSEIEADNRL